MKVRHLHRYFLSRDNHHIQREVFTITDENDQTYPIRVTSIQQDKTMRMVHFEIPETGQSGFIKHEWVMTDSMVITPEEKEKQ